MQFGVCGDPAVAKFAAAAGFDFCEWSVGGLLKPRDSREDFLKSLERARSAELPYPVVNCFVPGDLKITGPDADLNKLQDYATTTFERAGEAGVEVIVFGSGGARAVPEGFDPREAHDQIVKFCRMFAPIAGQHGVTVVAEPLNSKECNIMTSVGECAALVREVDHPNLRLLVDSYHFLLDNDSYDDIITNGDLFAHVHVATAPKRVAPGADVCDLAPFFNALKQAGYNGRVSIEGKLAESHEDLPVAIREMRRLGKILKASSGGPAD